MAQKDDVERYLESYAMTQDTGRGMLSPFVVDFSRGSITEIAPEIDMFPEANLYDIDIVEEDDDSGLFLNRKERRRGTPMINAGNNAFTDIVATVDSLFHEIDDEAERIRAAADLYGRWLQQNYPRVPEMFDLEGQLYDALSEDYEFRHKFAHSIIAGCVEFKNRTYSKLVEDPQAQYELVKLLTSIESVEVYKGFSEERREDQMALNWLNFLALSPDTAQAPSLYDMMRSGLADGAYDGFIASDLLKYVRKLPEEDTPKDLLPLRKLLDLSNAMAVGMTGMESTVEKPSEAETAEEYFGQDYQETMVERALEVVASNQQLWGREQQTALAMHRRQLEKTLANIRTYVSVLNKKSVKHIEPGADPDEVFAKAMDDSLTTVVRAWATVNGYAVPKSVVLEEAIRRLNKAGRPAEEGAESGEPRKRKRRLATAAEDTARRIEDSSPEADEKESPELQIRYVDGDGYSHDDRSDQFRRMVRKYLDSYGAGVPTLGADISTVLEYMSRTSLTDFPPGAVEKVNDSKVAFRTQAGTYKKVPAWRLRVDKLPELKKDLENFGVLEMCRIYFVLLDEPGYGIRRIERKSRARRLGKIGLTRGNK